MQQVSILRWARKLTAAWLAFSGLGACDLRSVEPQFSVVQRTDDSYYVPGALAATSSQFFGNSSRGQGGLNLPPGLLEPGSGTRFAVRARQESGVGMIAQTRLKDGFAIEYAFGISQRNSRYFLPDGVGILTDPILISFRSQSIEVALGVTKENIMGNLASRYSGGVGVVRSNVETRVRSDLLDVLSRSLQVEPFLFARVGVDLSSQGRTGTEVFSEIRDYASFGWTMNSGIAWHF